MLPHQSEPCSAESVGKHSFRRSKAWKAWDGRESRSIKLGESSKIAGETLLFGGRECLRFPEVNYAALKKVKMKRSKTSMIGLTVKIGKGQAKLVGSQTVGSLHTTLCAFEQELQSLK